MSRGPFFTVVLALLCVGCGTNEHGALSGTGSSFVEPVLKEWAGEYQKAKGVKITYEAVGSRAGVERLGPGVFDFACTDAPLSDKELEKLKERGGDVVQVPLVLGAVVPVYHLDEIKEPLTFTGPILSGIYLGKIKKWNDKAIGEANPTLASTLPEKDIVPIHRTDGSGTTYIWTDFLRMDPDWKPGVGSSITWPTGPGEPGTNGVIKKLKDTPYSLAYVPLSYAVEQKLTIGLVKNAEGTAVKASPASVTAAAKAALKTIPDDLRFSLANAPGKESYPISGTTWAVVYTKSSGAQSASLADFLLWAIHDGQAFAEKLQYAPLPAELVQRVESKLAPLKQ